VTKDPRIVVWIVDDAISVRKSIAAVLEAADLVVRDYGSADEFLADFAPMEPGCVVVDHHMPGMTGLELLLHLRREGITVPVIVITGRGDAVLKEKALKAGAVTMLHKPVDGDELITLIECVVSDRA
jgi:two-component system CheB/CheR fusion protein